MAPGIIPIVVSENESGISYSFEMKDGMSLYFRQNGDDLAIGLCRHDEEKDCDDVIFASESAQSSGMPERLLHLLGKYTNESNILGMEKKDMDALNEIGNLCSAMIRSPMPVYSDRLPDMYSAALDRLMESV